MLDGDLFEGRFRDRVHGVDVPDLMGRMVKESYSRSIRRCFSPSAPATRFLTGISDAEARLYKKITRWRYLAREAMLAEKEALDRDSHREKYAEPATINLIRH